MKKLFILFLIFLSGLAQKLSGEKRASVLMEIHTVNNAVAEALEKNPELMHAKKKHQAAKSRVLKEAAFKKPRLDFERMHAPRDRNPITGADEKNIAVSQEIPFPTTLYARTSRARRSADIAEAEYQAKEKEIIKRVTAACSRFLLSAHALEIIEENSEILRNLTQVLTAKYAAQKGTQSGVLKAQVELSKMLAMKETARQEKRSAKALINALIDRKPDAELLITFRDTLPAISLLPEELMAVAEKNRPELKRSDALIRRANTEVWLARSDYLPDFMVSYRRRNMTGAQDSHDIMAGITLPLWFWSQGGSVGQAKAERDMAYAEDKALLNQTRYEIQDMWVKADSAYRLSELYRTNILPLAEQSLEIAQAGYRGDQIDFIDLLDAIRSLFDFRLEYYQYTAEYEITTAELERLTGVNLFGGKGE